ncbi:MAG: two-component system chemotaxis response regulator CheB [Glaciecola sp.]|jgi:two-component system chemotaxis response regulator CheB|mmetsp:Transcript_6237/g.21402  ORF Transcript_6237/g.21402 Transcript_6237/m.21402 type:complete len:371 (-) Transcript_6237:783-1895(-)
MPYRVLIVDDSTFYRRRLASFLEKDPSIQIVGQAINGLEAVEKAKTLKPDVITMDVEMPVMDGISAVTKIMQVAPTAILMFSSLTHEGAKVTLDALAAGAIDFIPKNFDDVSKERPAAILIIQRRVKALARSRLLKQTTEAKKTEKPAGSSNLPTFRASKLPAKPVAVSSSPMPATGKRYKLLFIGASTGGPVALQTVISGLPADFPYPVILVQHMPGTFTAAFAERLNKHSQLKVKLAENNDRIEKGTVYLAEGGKQLQVTGKGAFARINIVKAPKESAIIYHPSIDFTMESLVGAYSGDILSVILTGMGSDGSRGGKLLKEKGATIWAQDEKSSVIYGMPKAVAESGTCDRVIPLNDIAEHIINEMKV